MDITTNSAQFKDQLKQVKKALELNFSTVMRAAMLTLLTRVVQRTPISPYEREDPGRLAGSWSISRDKVGSFVIPEGRSSSREEALERAGRLMFSNPYAVWYIYNLVPYAEVVEYGLYPGDGPRTVGGFSKQAPAGMLRISIAEFSTQLERLVNRVVR